MKIRSNRGLIPTAFVCAILLFLVLLFMLFGQDLYSETPSGIRWLWILGVLLAYALLTLPSIVVFGRTLEVRAEGCTISLGRIRRFYSWDQFQTRRVEVYKRSHLTTEYEKCVFLSMRWHPPGEGRFTGNCMYLHPWTDVTIHSNRDRYKKQRARDRSTFVCYEVDWEQFTKRMREWGVEIEGLTA